MNTEELALVPREQDEPEHEPDPESSIGDVLAVIAIAVLTYLIALLG